MSDITFGLTDDQAGAVQKAIVVAERIWSGDFTVVADLAGEKLLRGRGGALPADIEHVREMLALAVDCFNKAAGVPIFAGKLVEYDPEARSISEESLPAFCDALDLFTRVGLVQLVILDEVGRDEVFLAPGSQRAEVHLSRARDAIDLAGMALGHSPRSSHSIGSPHLDISFKRAYEVMKQARRFQAEWSGSPDMRSSVHGDGLIVRYTQDPAPTVSSVHPVQKASF